MSALEAARAAQARAEEQSNQLAYAVSHDLRAHIRHLSGFLALLEETQGAKLDGDGKEFLGYCRDAAHRLDQMSNDLLVYSRIGRKESPWEAVDLGAVASRVADELAEANPGFALQARGLPVVTAEPAQMELLWRHLLGNAAKFRHPERAPRVEATAERAGGRWVLRVADNGIGMEPKDTERAFGMFTQLHARGTIAGNGAGLALVRKVAERHGGLAIIESSGPEGTTVRIELQPQEDTT